MNTSAAHAVVEFPDGLPGFETCRQFVILSGPAVEPFTIVQGLGPDAPAFAAIDPLRVVDGYRAELEPADLARLGANNSDATPLVFLALVSANQAGQATVNLRAPLVINPATLLGIQLIGSESTHAVDHPLRAA
jgi:flagellar assembly factor FliW